MAAKNSIKTNLELLYITSQTFPATKASGVQVMQMCEAFASIGAKVKISCPRTRQEYFVRD